MLKKRKRTIETTVESLEKGKIRIINSIKVVGVNGKNIVKCIDSNKEYKLIKPIKNK